MTGGIEVCVPVREGVRLACCTRLEGDCRMTLSGHAHSQICLSGVMDTAALRPRFCTYGAAVDIGTNGEMELTQKDVCMVQLAKSAISAGLRTLMHTAGISCPDVAELAVSGGFGSYLDAANAGRIGLIPQEPVPRVRVLGNAALSGASMLLLDRELAPACEYLAQRAKTLELSANPVFTQYYTEGMFF